MSTIPLPDPQRPPPPPDMSTETEQRMLNDILVHLCVIPAPPRDAPPPAKRSRKSAAPANATADRYRNAARFFPRGIDLFKSVSRVLEDGALACWSADPPESPTAELQAAFDYNKKLFEDLITHLGTLGPVLRHLYAHYPHAWTSFVQEFNHVTHQARQSDTNELKPRFDYLLPTPGRDVLDPPLTNDDKTDRDWAHPWTSRLLMPIKDHLSLPPHPFKSTGLSPPDLRDDKQKRRGDKIEKRMNEQRYVPDDQVWPSFVYDMALYDRKDPTSGLMRSYILERVLRHTWLTASKAINGLDSNGIPAQCNATTHKTYRVTTKMVAYAVCQINCMLQPKAWDKCTGNKVLYEEVLELFDGKDADEGWAGDTLVYLQGCVFGHHRAPQPARTPTSDDEDSDSDDDSMEAIRRINRARREERDV